jgi:hypothetical protein
MTRIALVEGLQKELSVEFPWVEKVVVVRQEPSEGEKKLEFRV